jgi:hypothetical protein
MERTNSDAAMVELLASARSMQGVLASERAIVLTINLCNRFLRSRHSYDQVYFYAPSRSPSSDLIVVHPIQSNLMTAASPICLRPLLPFLAPYRSCQPAQLLLLVLVPLSLAREEAVLARQ